MRVTILRVAQTDKINEGKRALAAMELLTCCRNIGLEILAPGIEPINKTNTRFLVVGSEEKGNTRGNKGQSVLYRT